jgi:hypothetical protein
MSNSSKRPPSPPLRAYTQPDVPPATQTLPTISFSSETPSPPDRDPKDVVLEEMLVKAKKKEMKEAAKETQKAVYRDGTNASVVGLIEWAKQLGRKRK